MTTDNSHSSISKDWSMMINGNNFGQRKPNGNKLRSMSHSPKAHQTKILTMETQADDLIQYFLI